MKNSEKFLLKVRDFLENLGYNTPIHFLVWTTTPWTLPCNLALAINKNIEYCAFICDESLNGDKPSIFVASRAYFDKQKENHWFLGGFKIPVNNGKMEDGFGNALKLGILQSYFFDEKEFSKKYAQYLSDSAEHFLKTKNDPKFSGQYEPLFPYFKNLAVENA